MNEHAYTNTLIDAMQLIDAFTLGEFGSDSNDYTDMSRVPIAYTTIGDNDEIERQVYIDLLNYQIIREDNGNIAEIVKYNTLNELIENELTQLDFGTLIFG